MALCPKEADFCSGGQGWVLGLSPFTVMPNGDIISAYTDKKEGGSKLVMIKRRDGSIVKVQEFGRYVLHLLWFRAGLLLTSRRPYPKPLSDRPSLRRPFRRSVQLTLAGCTLLEVRQRIHLPFGSGKSLVMARREWFFLPWTNRWIFLRFKQQCQNHVSWSSHQRIDMLLDIFIHQQIFRQTLAVTLNHLFW